MEQTLGAYRQGAVRTHRIPEGRGAKRIVGLLAVLWLVGCSSDEPTTRTVPEGGLVLRGIAYTVAPIDFPQLLFTRADGINDAGQIVGTGACLDPCGFLFPPGSVFALPGALVIIPKDISNVGQIVGSFGNRSCNGIPVLTDGFLLDTNTNTFTPLNFPGTSSAGCPPGNVSFPRGINDAGQIVGTLGGHGFLRDAGTFIMIDGRCLTGVDSRSKWAPEFVAIDEQPYDEIMHVFRLREAQRPTY